MRSCVLVLVLHACTGNVWNGEANRDGAVTDASVLDGSSAADNEVMFDRGVRDATIDTPSSNQPVASLSFGASNLEIGSGIEIVLPLVALDAAGQPTNAAVDISIGNGNVVRVGDRSIRGALVGDATVMASANGHTAMISVSVRQGYREIRGGFKHSCGVSPTGELYCWGCNNSGETGFPPGYGGSNAQGYQVVRAPARVPTIPNVATLGNAIASGWNYTCALAESTHHVWCWGNNTEWNNGSPFETGHLGRAGSDWMPMEAHSQLSFRSLYAGSTHTCGITMTGQLYCWGKNQHGELGVGDTTTGPSARMVGNFRTASLGYEHSCAINDANELYCWGQNADGQLGLGNTNGPVLTPQRVSGGPWRDVETGEFYSCATAMTGVSYCWGRNEQNKRPLGVGDVTEPANLSDPPIPSVLMPRMLGASVMFAQLAAGFRSSCAITSDGELYCWGSNDLGLLAHATTDWRASVPMRSMDNGLRFSSIYLGRKQPCAITTTGVGYCWGENWVNTLGTVVNYVETPSGSLTGDEAHGAVLPSRLLDPAVPTHSNQPMNCDHS